MVHGMLTASLFSSVFGTLIPGSVYREQSFTFHSPVYVDECIIGRVNVTNVKDLRRKGLLVTCDTVVYKKDDVCGLLVDSSVMIDGGDDDDGDIDCIDGMTVCVKGEAKVLLPRRFKP